jgi:glycosyltransferase involved in cell wall biosynthesis
MTSPRRPLLSIVIPTRERASVLQYTLETVLALRNPDFEIIVCDNLSTDDTRSVVARFSDPRLKYSCSDKRLTMPQNFERGLKLATGEFIMTIGDDDLLIEENVELALASAAATGADLVYWNRAVFYWGSYPDTTQNGAFMIPNGRAIHPVDTRALMATAYRNLISYQYLPSVYNSLCRRSILDRYYAFLHGQFFPEYVVSVDVFSSLVLSSLNPVTYYQDSPASLSGISKHSNGMSLHNGGAEAVTFAKELGYEASKHMMPEEFRGKVEPVTNQGIMQLSIMADFYNLAERVLKYTETATPSLAKMSEACLRQLHADGHIAVSPHAAEYQAMLALDEARYPIVREDTMTWFFRQWAIPAPSYYAGRFEGDSATVRDLHIHLTSIGYNKAPG